MKNEMHSFLLGWLRPCLQQWRGSV